MFLPNRFFLGLVFCTALFGIGCWEKESEDITQIEEYLIETEQAIAELIEHQNQLKTAVNDSIVNLRIAVLSPNPQVDDQQVQDFVSQWSRVESSHKKFEQGFETIVEKTDFLFAYAEYENSLIRNDPIYQKLTIIIKQENKERFENLLLDVKKNLGCVKEEIGSTKNVIKAFELDIIKLLPNILEELQGLDDSYKNSLIPCSITLENTVEKLQTTISDNGFSRLKEGNKKQNNE